jgi:hypothetical protein
MVVVPQEVRLGIGHALVQLPAAACISGVTIFCTSECCDTYGCVVEGVTSYATCSAHDTLGHGDQSTMNCRAQVGPDLALVWHTQMHSRPAGAIDYPCNAPASAPAGAIAELDARWCSARLLLHWPVCVLVCHSH